MTIYECAREMGKLLSETGQGRRLADAKYIFDGNKEAQVLFFEYRDYRNYYKDKQREAAVTDADSQKFNELTAKIQDNAIVCELLMAENEFDELFESVFDVVRATAEGEMPTEKRSGGGCTGSCSTCGGCM